MRLSFNLNTQHKNQKEDQFNTHAIQNIQNDLSILIIVSLLFLIFLHIKTITISIQNIVIKNFFFSIKTTLVINIPIINYFIKKIFVYLFLNLF